jgi:hypothetical protein
MVVVALRAVLVGSGSAEMTMEPGIHGTRLPWYTPYPSNGWTGSKIAHISRNLLPARRNSGPSPRPAGFPFLAALRGAGVMLHARNRQLTAAHGRRLRLYGFTHGRRRELLMAAVRAAHGRRQLLM